MTFLKVLGWIFVPIIMIIVQWKRLGLAVRIIGGIWTGIFLLGFISNITSDKTPKDATEAMAAPPKQSAAVTETKAPKVTASPKPTVAPTNSPKPTTAPVVVQESSPETSSQRNAVRAAKNYLDYTAFSRQGLIKQLIFEKYSDADAKYAVDQIGADWNEQATKTAKNYLDYSAFSKQDLIKQLEFDGYTSEQAAYGVDKSYK